MQGFSHLGHLLQNLGLKGMNSFPSGPIYSVKKLSSKALERIMNEEEGKK